MESNLNRLEMALLDPSNLQLEFYIEDVSNETIRNDILEIKNKAICSTPSGIIKKRLIDLINNI